MKNVSSKAIQLMKKIVNMPGDKLVTISSPHRHDVFYIEEGGEIDDSRQRAAKLLNMIGEGMLDEGSMIIRQFTDEEFEVETPNGKESFPKSNIYGVQLGKRKFLGISAKTMKKIHCIDPMTGTSIPPEEGVRYCSFHYKK